METRPLRPKGRHQPLRAGPSQWARRRVNLGLSQRRLAELSGIGRDVISRVESGRMIPTPLEAASLLRVYEAHEEAIK